MNAQTASTSGLYGPFGHSRTLPQTRDNGPMILYGIIVVLTFALGVMTTLLVLQPAQTPAAQTPVAVAPAPTPAPQPAAALEQLVSASLEDTAVTRAAPLDLLAPVPQHPLADVLRGLQSQASPIFAPLPADDTISEAEAQAAADRKAQRDFERHMRMLKEAMLARVYDVEVRDNDGKQQLMLRPVNLELSRGFLKDLLQAAADRGEVTFPDGLSTADGTVDLDTMLFNLVQDRLAGDGTIDGAKAAREMARRAFEAAGLQTADEVQGERSYVVEPGDSLAYISLKFYGRPGAYVRIFEANRGVLKSPDQIRIGQRLVIPG